MIDDAPSELPDYGTSGFVAVRTGSGTALESCGKHAKIIACFDPSCDYEPIFIDNCCHRNVCPVCYDKTIERSAQQIEERMNELVALWRKEGKDLRTPHHWEFSPDDQAYWSKDRVEEDGGRALWREFAKKLKAALPYYREDAKGQRVSEERYKAMSREEKRMTRRRTFDHAVVAAFHGQREKFLYNGQWVSKEDLPHEDDPEEYRRKYKFDWFWGPHFHVIGFAYFMNAKAFKDRSSWIYVKVPERDGEERVIYSTVKYILSHATAIVYRHTDYHGQEKERQYKRVYNYYGLVSNAKGSFLEEIEEEDRVCPVCQKAGRSSYLHEFHIITIGEEERPDRGSDLGVHRQLKVHRSWYINKVKGKGQRTLDGTGGKDHAKPRSSAGRGGCVLSPTETDARTGHARGTRVL